MPPVKGGATEVTSRTHSKAKRKSRSFGDADRISSRMTAQFKGEFKSKFKSKNEKMPPVKGGAT